MGRFTGIIGILVLLGIAYACSRNRKAINWRSVGGGFALQIIFALMVLKTAWGRDFFEFMNKVILKLLSFTDAGASFVFGNLVTQPDPQSAAIIGYIFAVRVLPAIIFVSAIMGILYYLGIMQKVIVVIAKIMAKTMQTSGAESLSASANIFVGQTEAPLVIKPYIEKMTRSEIMAVMTGGMATVSGGILAGYVGMLVSKMPDIAGHLLAASIMAAPAGLAMAKIIVPETEESETRGTVKMDLEIKDANIIDAAANGSSTGMQLAINVAACLIGFVALIALCNYVIGWGGHFFGWDLSLDKLLGWMFWPLAWTMGVPTSECMQIATLMGQKTAINEFVAFGSMAAITQPMSHKAMVIASYALCGFANFSSIAIQIGGIGGMAPSRRADLAKLGLWALLAASLASFFSATIAGMMVG